jgi:NADH:ubiquinone oxidoreductase subunit 6 (subunit J)
MSKWSENVVSYFIVFVVVCIATLAACAYVTCYQAIFGPTLDAKAVICLLVFAYIGAIGLTRLIEYMAYKLTGEEEEEDE